MTEGLLAVALHDVEPRSFVRVREIRQWLLDRGIWCVTLLVIPAADLHPIGARAPALAAWLRARVAAGDAVAQHGLAHKAGSVPPWPRSIFARWQAGAAAEFPGLSAEETLRRVDAGRRLLQEIGLNPRGFVAPGYAYTRALKDVIGPSFDWFAELRRVRTRSRCLNSPALCLGSSTPLKRLLSPPVVRAARYAARGITRLDIHPADFDLPTHVATLESLLTGADGCEAVTYNQLAG